MPSMTTSHGGILYYVVKVPKEETPAPQQQEPWYPDKPSATSTPLSKQHETSTDSGWDNPFRPDGDLSREADEIVEMINSGKPITPTALNGEAPKLPESTENGKAHSPTKVSPLNATAKGANGTKLSNGDKPGQVELQRATVVQPIDASQVEHVNLKKKPKCKCCVIQ